MFLKLYLGTVHLQQGLLVKHGRTAIKHCAVGHQHNRVSRGLQQALHNLRGKRQYIRGITSVS